MTSKELSLRQKTELQNGEKTYSVKVYVPEVDIFEQEDALIVKADMPGVEKSDVEVNLEDGILTIEGKINPKEYDNLRTLYSEYHVGHYRRQFTLGELIDQQKIEAKMENGTLNLTLPKAEKARPKTITIR